MSNKRAMLFALMAGSGAALPAPTTATFTDTQSAAGFQGFFDTATTAGHRLWAQKAGQWFGVITGTDCDMFCTGGNTTPYSVIVDGGATVIPTLAGGKISIFAGLAHGPHTVVIFANNSTSGSTWTPTSGNLFSVTGRPPSMDVSAKIFWPKDPSFPGFETQNQIATMGGNFVPTYLRPSSAGTGWYADYGTMHFRARFNDIYVSTDDVECWYSVDGGAWTRTILSATQTNAAGNLRTWKKVAAISGDAGSTYREIILMTGNPTPSMGGTEAIMLTGASASMLAPTVTKSPVVLFGASQVAGIGATSPGSVDIYRLQMVIPTMAAQQAGNSGQTIVFAVANFATWAASVKTKATIILSIGINSADDANFQGDYTNLINAALTAGFTKVICRGLVQASVDNTGKNTKIAAAVTAVANVAVTFANTSTWTASTNGSVGIWMPDGSHPNDTGYVTVATLDNSTFGASLP